MVRAVLNALKRENVTSEMKTYVCQSKFSNPIYLAMQHWNSSSNQKDIEEVIDMLLEAGYDPRYDPNPLVYNSNIISIPEWKKIAIFMPTGLIKNE